MKKLLQPRFSVRTLAIVVTIAAFGVWWVTWPARTAKTFVGLLGIGKFEEASQMMATVEDREFIIQLGQSDEMQAIAQEVKRTKRKDVREVELLDRSWSDVFFARGFFGLGIDTGCYVQRGHVSFESFVRPE
jgi:hypothetical protein